MRQRGLRILLAALAGAAVLAILHVALADAAWLRRLETTTLDWRMRLRGPIAPGPETTIVLADDATLQSLGRWPLPRARYAELVERLHRAGARVIAFDILFAESEAPAPDEASFLADAAAALAPTAPRLAEAARQRLAGGDARFAAAVAAASNVVLPFSFRFGPAADGSIPDALARSVYQTLRGGALPELPLRPSGVLPPIEPLAAAAAALGHALVAFDVDGAPRYDYPVLELDLDYYASLPVRVAQLFLGVPWRAVRVEFGRGIAIGPAFLPTDAAMRVPVNYRGPARSFPTFPLEAVLAGTVPDAAFRDRIVLVGAKVAGIHDSFETPFTSVLPGVERLATIVDQILHGDTIRQPALAPFIEGGVMLLAAAAMGAAVAALPIGAAAFAGALILAALAVLAHLAFVAAGLWFALAAPVLALALLFLALVLYRHLLLDREHRVVRDAFQHYLAPHLLDEVARRPAAATLGGELRELTILFCDVRGFTALSERLAPERLTRFLNAFFTPVSEVILRRGGTIDKFIGDCVMAFWNAPLADERHAEEACRAALEIAALVPELAARLAADDPALAGLAIGIGINTGPATVGNFGSARRFDYSAIGDAVNLAARLETETKAYRLPIIIGPATAARVPMLATLPIDRVRVRGRAAPIEIHALLGDEAMAADVAFTALRERHLLFRAAFLARDWSGAEQLLAGLAANAPPPLDELYAACASRLAALLAAPPGAGWDGGFIAERRRHDSGAPAAAPEP